MSNLFRFPLTDRNTDWSELGKNRTILMRAYNYTVRKNNDLESRSVQANAVGAIAMFLPSSFSDTLTQNWDMGEIMGGKSLLHNILTAAGSKLGSAINNLAQIKTGTVLAPPQELMYSGPAPRTVDFSWELSPRNKNEEVAIKNIVSAFKRWSSPRKTANYFLDAPCVWDITVEAVSRGDSSFLTMGFEEGRYWACTSVTYSPTPDGNFYSHHDGFPVKSSLSVTFSELIPLMRDENNDSIAVIDRQNRSS